MKIAIAGKGGTGKTTIASWLGDYLARQGHDVWLIDADTALSLGRASGLGAEELPVPLIARADLINERIGAGLLNLNPDVADLPEQLSVPVPLGGPALAGIVPGQKRLLVMGTVAAAGGGCACSANALLKAVLAQLFYDEQTRIIVDLEAGVEHLGRGTAAKADGLIIVSEGSLRSLETAARIATLAKELGLSRQVLALNRIHHDDVHLDQLSTDIQEVLPTKWVAFPPLASLAARMMTGASVVGLPEEEEIDAILAELLLALGL